MATGRRLLGSAPAKPLGVWLVRRLIPAAVLADGRAAVEAGSIRAGRLGFVGAAVIILLWAITIGALIWGGVRVWR